MWSVMTKKLSGTGTKVKRLHACRVEWINESGQWKMEELEGKMAGCQEAGAAQSMCIPFYDKLEKVIKAAKTMKVRMT